MTGMPRFFIIRGRGLMAIVLPWLVLEAILLALVIHRFGWGLTILALIVKGIGGLALLGYLAARGMRRMTRGGPREMGAASVVGAGFRFASALMIAAPGFIPALVGLALFSPSVRTRILRLIGNRGARQADPRIIDLEDSAWSEVRTRRPRKPRAHRSDGEAQPPSLEAGPPSV